jgi:hypothetical protein
MKNTILRFADANEKGERIAQGILLAIVSVGQLTEKRIIVSSLRFPVFLVL